MDNLTKKQKRKRTEGPKILAETLAKWIEINKDVKAKMRKAPAKGSTKGCMKGKGGPENSRCSFRGVRQQTWGKRVAELRQPNGGKKLWLGTFGSAVEAALAYGEAARAMYGPSARINLPNYYPNASLLCKTTSSCVSNITCSQSESSKVCETKTAQNVCAASASEVGVAGICNDDGNYQGFPEDDMFNIDEILGVMDQKDESINEEGSSGQPMCDAWFENKPDDLNQLCR
nr:dehydration-responsive element-binding protein 2A-like [Tanacetum cinerariifolium]